MSITYEQAIKQLEYSRDMCNLVTEARKIGLDLPDEIAMLTPKIKRELKGVPFGNDPEYLMSVAGSSAFDTAINVVKDLMETYSFQFKVNNE